MDHISLKCNGCQAKLKMPRSAAGRRIKCPKCETISTVPRVENTTAIRSNSADPKGAPVDKPPKSPFDSTGENKPSTETRCTHCGVSVTTDAVICVSCGTNLQTGKRNQTAVVVDGLGAKSAGESTERHTGTPRSLPLGCIGCALGTALGAAGWIAFALYTKHELALLAILVGGLSGLGMYWGYRDVGFLAGLVAALFAMSGIVAARVYILQKLFNTDEGPAELFVSAVFATGWWGILIVGVAMFIAFKVGTTGPDVFDDD